MAVIALVPFAAFSIDATPIAKGRGRVGMGGRVFTPARTRKWESEVRFYAQQAMAGRKPTDGPVSVQMCFTFQRPKKPKKGSTDFVTKRPDIDNLMKAVLDGVNGVIFEDDRQVCEVKASKVFDDRSRVDVSVWRLA